MIDMKLCNYLIGVLGLLLGLFMMHSASAFSLSMTETGPGAGVWPFALGVVLALAGLVLLGHTFWNRKSLAVRLVVINTPASLRIYIVMVLAVLFLPGDRTAGLLSGGAADDPRRDAGPGLPQFAADRADGCADGWLYLSDL